MLYNLLRLQLKVFEQISEHKKAIDTLFSLIDLLALEEGDNIQEITFLFKKIDEHANVSEIPQEVKEKIIN